MTECNTNRLEFHGLGRRQVVAQFDGGQITSDAGGLLLREIEQRTGIIQGLAGCFIDQRDARSIEHSVEQLVGQRVYGLCLGYEDLNDHDELRYDPLLAVLVGKPDPQGTDRRRPSDRGKALAGKSTLNRLELTPAPEQATAQDKRYKKIVMQAEKIDQLLVDIFLKSRGEAPDEIVLDLDATDDPLHGKQEGRFFHGYYREYCYLPLYIFCGDDLLCARLRTANQDGAAGSLAELKRIIGQIRVRWPEVAILIRGDSGFCREELMAWCEGQTKIDYVLGLAKNSRLAKMLATEMAQAKAQFEATQQAARVFKDFRYQTRESWGRERRVVGKAEHLEKGANPRFVVTSLAAEVCDARRLYEERYCERGEMENRIKEQHNDLAADRTSTGKLRANQLRLYFSSIAYVLMNALRRFGLAGTEMAQAQCQTIRLKLLKIGAQIRVTVRKVWVSLSSSYPYAALFTRVYEQVRQMRPLRC